MIFLKYRIDVFNFQYRPALVLTKMNFNRPDSVPTIITFTSADYLELGYITYYIPPTNTQQESATNYQNIYGSTF